MYRYILNETLPAFYTSLQNKSGYLVKVVWDGNPNPNPTTYLDPERIRNRNLNCGFGLIIFITFVSFKKIYFHSISHA